MVGSGASTLVFPRSLSLGTLHTVGVDLGISFASARSIQCCGSMVSSVKTAIPSASTSASNWGYPNLSQVRSIIEKRDHAYITIYSKVNGRGVVVCLGALNSNERPAKRDARRPNSWWRLGMSSKTVKDLTAGTAGGICQVSTLIQHAPLFRL